MGNKSYHNEIVTPFYYFYSGVAVYRKRTKWISGFLAPLVNKGKKGESYDTWMNELLNCLAPPFICSY